MLAVPAEVRDCCAQSIYAPLLILRRDPDAHALLLVEALSS